MKKLCTKQDIIENLAAFLPDEQQPFKNTQPYYFLCEAVYRVLKASIDERPDEQQALKYARQEFKDFCTFMTDQKERNLEKQRLEREAIQAKVDLLTKKEKSKHEERWDWINK